MLKKILYIIAGVAAVVLGHIIGGRRNINRGRVARTKPDFDGIRDAHDAAEGGISDAGARLADSSQRLTGSQRSVDRLIDSNSRSGALIGRGREILSRAKARNGGGGST